MFTDVGPTIKKFTIFFELFAIPSPCCRNLIDSVTFGISILFQLHIKRNHVLSYVIQYNFALVKRNVHR